jgi:hypothetical protein
MSSDPIDPLAAQWAAAEKARLISNLQGVFADLDDGGLTEDEALDQIRDILERAETGGPPR